MNIDSTGRAHKPAGSPASTGGQYATQPTPAAAASLDEPASIRAGLDVARIANALRAQAASDEITTIAHDHGIEITRISSTDMNHWHEFGFYGPDGTQLELPPELEEELNDSLPELIGFDGDLYRHADTDYENARRADGWFDVGDYSDEISDARGSIDAAGLLELIGDSKLRQLNDAHGRRA